MSVEITALINTQARGPVGPTGQAGATGPQGPTGATGATGPAGSDATVTAANVLTALQAMSPAQDAAAKFAIGMPIISVKDYGAVGNAKCTEFADMTSGSAALSTTGYSGFAVGDVGKKVIVYGAGSAGVPLETTIAAYTSATQVTLSATASTTVANSAAVWGTDDSAAFAAAVTAAKASTVTRTIYVPVGQYLANVVLNEPNLQIVGTSSRQGFYQPADAENAVAGKLGSVIFAADPDEPVISMPSAGTGNAFGSRIQDIQLCGFLKTGFGLEIGDREFAATGYPGHSWTIHNVNFVGFKYAMTIASAGSATVTNCAASECEFGFHVAEVPFLSSNGISDNVIFTSCVTTNTDYSFIVAASKNTVIQSGDFNYPITWVTVVDNGTVNVIGANVEYASTSVVDIQTGGKFIANHMQVLGDFKIRNYSTTGTELVDLRSSSAAVLYMTAGLEYPARLTPGGFILRYNDTTWTTRNRQEITADYGLSEMQKADRRRVFLGQENWTKVAASPYGDWNWLLTQIGGGMAVRSSSITSDGFELYSTSTGTGNSGRLAMGRAIRFFPNAQKFRIPMRVVGMSTSIFRVGLYSLDGTVDLLPDHGIGIKVDTTASLDSTIKLEFRNGGTVTEVDTTVPVSNTNYYYLNLERTSTGWACILTNFAAPYAPLAAQVHLACSPAQVFVAPAIFAGVSAAAYTQIHIYPGAVLEDTSSFVWIAP